MIEAMCRALGKDMVAANSVSTYFFCDHLGRVGNGDVIMDMTDGSEKRLY